MKNWWKKFLAWLNPRITLPSNTTPAMPDIPKPVPPVTVDPVIVPNPKPVIITDDMSVNIVIKLDGREVHNDGQVTYVGRFLTCSPFDGNNCVCVQYNDASRADGERTVFKDQSRSGIWEGMLPSNIPIDKIVCWYEKEAVTPIPVTPTPPVPVPVHTGKNNPDWNNTYASPAWSTNSARNYKAGRAKAGQYHGRISGFTPGPGTEHVHATNFRYNLRSHFEWDLKILSKSDETGCVPIVVSEDGKSVSWSTNP